jgi:hypothetical protein
MINFKDFGRVSGPSVQQFSSFRASAHLAEINAWIETEKVRVISVETLSSTNREPRTECVRVWYEELAK